MTPSLQIGKTKISIEVAKDFGAIRTGLSGRSSLAPKSGMLFIFPRPKEYRFWMRDMKFPIDIIWIEGDKVIGITEEAKNEFDPSRPAFHKAPAKVDRVLEVNAGFAKREKIQAGDTVTYHDVSRGFSIVSARADDKKIWNEFLEKNQPVVGAFLETWEWGAFKKQTGLDTKNYFVKEKSNEKDGKDRIAAIFTLHIYKLPLGMHYGYLPRGPIVAKDLMDEEIAHFEILKTIQSWAKKELPSYLFLRTEPSMTSISPDTAYYGFRVPPYNIQPPRNTIVPLTCTEEDILAGFHSTTRSNIRRAERRGVTVVMKKTADPEFYDAFFSMIKSTIKRRNGKKAYPSESYLRTLLSNSRILGEHDKYDAEGMTFGLFCGYQHGKPATTHVVVFCGDTATYLFGASHTEHLSSKVDTYLHWIAMREAKRRGMHWYDIGGIDNRIWPSLTQFKKQFSDKEMLYIGNLDVPLRPFLYRAYNIYRKAVKKINKQG